MLEVIIGNKVKTISYHIFPTASDFQSKRYIHTRTLLCDIVSMMLTYNYLCKYQNRDCNNTCHNLELDLH